MLGRSGIQDRKESPTRLEVDLLLGRSGGILLVFLPRSRGDCDLPKLLLQLRGHLGGGHGRVVEVLTLQERSLQRWES